MNAVHETLETARQAEKIIVRFVDRIIQRRRLLEINHFPKVSKLAAAFLIPQAVYGQGSDHPYQWGKSVCSNEPMVNVSSDGAIEVSYSRKEEIDLFYIPADILAAIVNETGFDVNRETSCDFGDAILNWVLADIEKVEKAKDAASSVFGENQ